MKPQKGKRYFEIYIQQKTSMYVHTYVYIHTELLHTKRKGNTLTMSKRLEHLIKEDIKIVNKHQSLIKIIKHQSNAI